MTEKKSIYCGVGDVPLGKKLGTEKECMAANQIRYYGIKKVNPKLLESKDFQSPEKEETKLLVMRSALIGMKKKLDQEKNKKKIDEKALEKIKNKIRRKMDEYEKQQEIYKKAVKFYKKN